ncbi:FAD/NAD(P)-binding domain-containing protein [Leucogyrophana mollusca]|uniref:FAD/NAD(P)-binding domain-containing protein n=1 Tax=Leucogyrophana mollusca TaxID=85980 RepID=A0ACB8BM83_9AGAM|nr:FAD/NAD(P)-binding domain-containing protein [Leucogyrophana mollusca]
MDILPNIPLESLRDELTSTKRICVIGAGPSGLAALKVISESPQYKAGRWSITAFEDRTNVGGVWLPAPPVDNPPLTPLYDSLTTNLPHPVMAYTSHSFPPSTPLFPNAAAVQAYLESFASHFNLLPLIRLNTTVTGAKWEAPIWTITLSTGEVLPFDHVIVANGHYRLPRIPDTPGLSEWMATGKASHSAWYRRPHNIGDVVLVVGGGPSGKDISAEMCSVAKVVIHSATGTSPEDIGNLKRRGRVIEFKSDGQVVFEDGTSEQAIDHCILATGYQMDFPFFEDSVILASIPPPSPPLPRDLFNSSYHVYPLAKHLFPLQSHYPPSSLAFMGLLIRVAPFPLLEAQARAIVRVFSDPSSLDTTHEAIDIITRSEQLQAAGALTPLQLSKAWHRFEEHQQFDYRNEMYEFAGRSRPSDEVIVVPDWEREMYHEKELLRTAWREVEQRGEAEKWVKGVGEGGVQEWVELMRSLLRWAKQGDPDDTTSCSRL